MKTLTELKKISQEIKNFNNSFYWINVIKRVYNLSDSEMGFIVCQLDKEVIND